MPDFNPSPHDKITIGGLQYTVMPHPAVPTFAFGQEGRKAMVYQVSRETDHSLFALKQFKLAFRVAEMVDVCDMLEPFAVRDGLEVCARQCLHHPKHADILGDYDELEYAVLMPWIGGSTWYDMVIGMTPLTRLESITYANATAQVLAALEESGLAHCDISAANVIINPNTGRAHLIDVEDMYAKNFTPPGALPAGTDGYAHKIAPKGLWFAEADRFAGAVLMAEMAAWHNKEIRKKADEEHYFDVREMQQDSERYQLMMATLSEIDTRLADLFERTWFSDTLVECPTLREWQAVFHDAHHQAQVSGVVSNWKPLSIPGVTPEEPASTPEPEPIATQPEPQPVEPEPVAAAPEPEPIEDEQPEPTPAPATPDPVPAQAPPQQQSAPQPMARQPQPANPNILQPKSPPPSNPPVINRPLQVQPQQGTGGPVVEWRPLGPSGGNNAAPPAAPSASGNRPIIVPPQRSPVVDDDPDPEPEPEPVAPPPVQEALHGAPSGEANYDEPGTMIDEPAVDATEVIPPVYDDLDPYDDAEAYQDDEVYGEGVEHYEDDEPYQNEYLEAEPEAIYDDQPVMEDPEPEPEPIYEDDPVEEPIYEDEPTEVYPDGLLQPILDFTGMDGNKPRLVWTESQNAASYELDEADNRHFDDAKRYKVKNSDTRWSPGLFWRKSGRLFYRVRALNEDGDPGPWSDTVRVRVGE